jgi:hypothetical protein
MENKYKNPDERCTYPYVPNDALDYCWGFAQAADNKSEETFKKVCLGCEFWEA